MHDAADAWPASTMPLLQLQRYCRRQVGHPSPQYYGVHPLFDRMFCTPATSAPVKRIFSQSGLLMRPHRARMYDSLLETLHRVSKKTVPTCLLLFVCQI